MWIFIYGKLNESKTILVTWTNMQEKNAYIGVDFSLLEE